jgi:hypothetical protein
MRGTVVAAELIAVSASGIFAGGVQHLVSRIIGASEVLVVHIGTQKTGSSALQAYLSENSEALLEQGVHYLRTGRVRSHGDLAQALNGRGNMALWQRARKELQRSDSATKVISAEGLWVTDPILLSKELPPDISVRIVVYLRRQDQYLQSLWKQAIAGGRKTAFGPWLEERMSRGDYFSTVERWAAIFGGDSIIVRPYERPDGVNTVADFCNIIGVSGLPTMEGVRRNFSPRRELAHFVRALNNLDARMNHRKLFRALIAKNGSYVRSCDMLSDEDASKLLQRYAEGNRLLAERYCRDFPAPLFPELSASPMPEIWSLDSKEFFQLTVDVLDVVIEQALAGRITDPGEANEKPNREKRRARHSAGRSKGAEKSGE